METVSPRLFLTDFIYYGSNDFAGGLFVKEVCDNIDYLESIVVDLNKEISSIQDMYHYLWCLSFKKMIDDINIFKIDDNLKAKILSLSDSINLSDASFVKFVNNNFYEIFDKQKHNKTKWVDFFYYVIELCYGKYAKGIKEDVYRYLELKYPLLLLNRFNLCTKYYSKHPDNFKTLFKDIKNTRVFDDQIYLRFLMNSTNRTDAFLKEQASFICERAIEEIRRMNLTSDSDSIVEMQSILQDYGRLAILYKLKYANDYYLLKKEIESKLNIFIKKHGKMHKIGPIEIKTAIDILKSSNNPYKFLQTTHQKTDNDKIINSLNYIFSVTNKNNPLSEVFNDISRNRSEKYPFFKQDSMQINLWLRTRMINAILNDSQLSKEYVNYVYNLSIHVQEKYFSSIIDIEKEITGIVDAIVVMIELAKQNQFDTPYGKTLVYGVSLAICTTIEKILRNVAIKETKDTAFIDITKITLADFFKDSIILADISDGLKYHLEFYLIKEVKFQGYDFDKPGLNIRNNLMHGQDDAFNNNNYETCLILFFFLMSLLTDLFLSVNEE